MRGRPFVKGQVANPAGRPKKLENEIKTLPVVSKQEVVGAFNKFMHMPIPELETYVKTKQGTAFEYTVARILAMAAIKGDPIRLDFLLNRLIGKVADKIDVTVKNPFMTMSYEEKLKKAKELVEILEANDRKRIE